MITSAVDELKLGEAVGSASLMTIASNYLVVAMQESIIWLLCMLALVLCDFIVGSIHSLREGINYRFSKAVRRTLGKIVVYFSVVLVAVLFEVATNYEFDIDKWVILIVAIVEASSILGHILAMRGYSLNWLKLVKLIARKKYEVAEDEIKNIVEKKEEEE